MLALVARKDNSRAPKFCMWLLNLIYQSVLLKTTRGNSVTSITHLRSGAYLFVLTLILHADEKEGVVYYFRKTERRT